MSLCKKGQKNTQKTKIWSKSTLAKWLATVEINLVSQIMIDYPLKGEGLWLQVDGMSELPWSLPTLSLQQIHLTPNRNTIYSNDRMLCGSMSELPCQTESLRGVLSVHALEYESQPWLALQEIDRVLAADGVAIMLGFNPYSLWGARKLLGSHEHIPWDAYFHSPFRLRRFWLNHGYQIILQRSYLFRPPLQIETWQRRLRWMEWVGQYCWPSFGGCYILVVQKQRESITPIRLSWKHKRRLSVKGLAEPTTYKNKCKESK